MTLRRLLVTLPLVVFGLSASAAGTAVGPAGYRILLASNRDGDTRAYSVLPDGSRLTPLLASSRALASPTLATPFISVACCSQA